MKKQERYSLLKLLITTTIIFSFAFSAYAGTIRGRVDYQAPNGYFPMPNALVEVWGTQPNGQQFMMAWTRSDQWGFYYLTLPQFNGQVQVWVNKSVFQPVYLHVSVPHVDVIPILVR